MNTANPPTDANVEQSSAESEPIPLYDRLVLWMFLAGFALFGVIIIGDLVLGFFR